MKSVGSFSPFIASIACGAILRRLQLTMCNEQLIIPAKSCHFFKFGVTPALWKRVGAARTGSLCSFANSKKIAVLFDYMKVKYHLTMEKLTFIIG